MAITFVEKKKRQRVLILVLLAILFVIAGVVWWGFFGVTAPTTESLLSAPRRVQVDTSILFHSVLKELNEPKETIQTLPEVGRDNPFLPAQ